MKSSFALLVVSCLGLSCFAVCPSADLTGDCYVDIADFAEFALQWLTGDGVPDDMVSIPGGAFQMGDSIYEGSPIELPCTPLPSTPFLWVNTQSLTGSMLRFSILYFPKV
jgi:hypothetical protein